MPETDLDSVLAGIRGRPERKHDGDPPEPRCGRSSSKAVLPPVRVRVSRSLYVAALHGAIDWQRSILALHDPAYRGAPSCCTPGSRCDAYKQSAALLARFERAKKALYSGRQDTSGTEQEAAFLQKAPRADAEEPPSVFRCAECGNGDQLRGWVHLNAHGPVGANGKIERYDYESEDEDEIIEESVTCRIHGEDFVEKLMNGEYTSTMVNGRYVAGRRAAP